LTRNSKTSSRICTTKMKIFKHSILKYTIGIIKFKS
jgi:hypothetical protein